MCFYLVFRLHFAAEKGVLSSLAALVVKSNSSATLVSCDVIAQRHFRFPSVALCLCFNQDGSHQILSVIVLKEGTSSVISGHLNKWIKY